MPLPLVSLQVPLQLWQFLLFLSQLLLLTLTLSDVCYWLFGLLLTVCLIVEYLLLLLLLLWW
jgi:hypothetical protein